MPRMSTGMVKTAAPRRKKAPKKKAASSVGRLRGRGDYTYDKPGPWGKAGSWIGNALGSAYAGEGGGKIGAKLGSYLHYIGKIFGSGDYVTSADDIKRNTVMNSAQVPSFGHGKNIVKITHREVLGDVYSSATPGAFDITDYPINPGLASSFPWLSQVCGASFQQYRINGMVFEFRSMSADALNSTNTALGSVIMATDYDSADSTFTSKQQMENTEFGVSCKPSSCMIHGIECARNQTSISELYIRAFGVPSGKDIRMYDMGRFSIATVGMQAASVNLGELWVSYDIDLIKAIEQPPQYITPFAQYTVSPTNVSSTSSLGLNLAQPTLVVDQIGLTFVRSSGTDTVQFPWNMRVGTMIYAFYAATGASTSAVATGDWSEANGLVSWANYSVDPYPGPTATSDYRSCTQIFRYDGSGTKAAPPTLVCAGGKPPDTLTTVNVTFAFVSSELTELSN